MDSIKVRDVIYNRQPSVTLTGVYAFEDFSTPKPATCDWVLERATIGLTVKGKLNAEVELECARCLRPFPVEVRLPILERYVFNHYVEPTGGERELQSDDFFETIDEMGELDLKDLVHQLLILETSGYTTCGKPECELQTHER